jgi:hypothetical protein
VSDTTEQALKPESDGASASGVNWTDPNVPAGDSPPMPRWPLVAGVAAWCAWTAFLVVMMILRLRASAA